MAHKAGLGGQRVIGGAFAYFGLVAMHAACLQHLSSVTDFSSYLASTMPSVIAGSVYALGWAATVIADRKSSGSDRGFILVFAGILYGLLSIFLLMGIAVLIPSGKMHDIVLGMGILFAVTGLTYLVRPLHVTLGGCSSAILSFLSISWSNIIILYIGAVATCVPLLMAVMKPHREPFLKDKDIVKIAKKRKGTLSTTILVEETGMDFEQADRVLKRLMKYGIARQTGSYYHVLVSDTDRPIIGIIGEHGGEIKTTELFTSLDLPIEGLESDLKRLEKWGLIVYDKEAAQYKLR